MNFVSVFMAVFSVIGAIDRIIGNRFGLGEKFEKGFMLLGNMALSMIGMIILSPYIADLLEPFFGIMKNTFHIDPSIVPAMFFANDMGGAPLAVETTSNMKIGLFNALVVSSMMGATFSFSIPYALGVVEEKHHKDMFLGFLCGIVTIPVGCVVSGIILNIPIVLLIINLLPLVIFSVIIVIGLVYIPMICIKIFFVFGTAMKIIITLGLMLGVLKFLTGLELVSGLDTLENGAAICLNASAVMSGSFVFLEIVSRGISKPLKSLGRKLDISETSALGFVSTIASNAITFEMLNSMDKKGVVLNSAFAVSAAFVFAGHLAFTMAFNAEYLSAVIVGKLVAGFSSIILAIIIYNKMNKR